MGPSHTHLCLWGSCWLEPTFLLPGPSYNPMCMSVSRSTCPTIRGTARSGCAGCVLYAASDWKFC